MRHTTPPAEKLKKPSPYLLFKSILSLFLVSNPSLEQSKVKSRAQKVLSVMSSVQSGASYLSRGFVMFFHVSCEGLPGQ